MREIEVTLIAKPGCHLCADARNTINEVLAQMGEAASGVTVRERNILEEPELARLHAEEIPVVLINGKRHAFWRVDGARFRASLQKELGRGRGIFGRK